VTGDRLAVRVPVATVWTAPDAPRDVDAPAVLDRPDLAAWTTAKDQATRRGLVGRTLTQALLGEPVRVLEERGEWVHVACTAQPSSQHAEGYPGWVRRSHLGVAADPDAPGTAVVVARTAPLTPDQPGTGPVQVSFGTALPVEETRGPTVRVRLPGGGRGTLPVDRVRVHPAAAEAADGRNQREEHGAAAALRLAARFLGVRYLWGGACGWGVDCSGLVHLAHRALGVTLARDAFDQKDLSVAPVPLDRVEEGDLYFFARPGERVYHVGFASRAFTGEGTRWMLHAPEGGELVEDAPMAAHRRDTLVAAGRVSHPRG
jgi:cell wall-associated NlpC family hydrolase